VGLEAPNTTGHQSTFNGYGNIPLSNFEERTILSCVSLLLCPRIEKSGSGQSKQGHGGEVALKSSLSHEVIDRWFVVKCRPGCDRMRQ
jgi:hypothetical protein